MKKFGIFALLVLFISGFNNVSFGARSTINASAEAERMYQQQQITLEEFHAIQTLENDIRIIDDEIAKCNKQKKGWIAATVIGSAGVVSTGIAAGVQGAKITKQKKELSAKETELKSLNEEKNNLK